jgi:hypothetical protein
MKFISDIIVDSASMAADVTSEGILLDQIYGLSFQCIYSGSPVGDLILQASCDDVTKPELATTWTNISGATVAIAAAGSTLFNVDRVYYKFIRVFFDRSSGSGSLTVTYNGKGV